MWGEDREFETMILDIIMWDGLLLEDAMDDDMWLDDDIWDAIIFDDIWII